MIEHVTIGDTVVVFDDEPSEVCQMSHRPSGETCGSMVEVREIEYVSMGQEFSGSACRECRDKMLTTFGPAWSI